MNLLISPIYNFNVVGEQKGYIEQSLDVLLYPLRIAYGKTVSVEKRVFEDLKIGQEIDIGKTTRGLFIKREMTIPKTIQNEDDLTYLAFTESQTASWAKRFFALFGAVLISPVIMVAYVVCLLDFRRWDLYNHYVQDRETVYKYRVNKETDNAPITEFDIRNRDAQSEEALCHIVFANKEFFNAITLGIADHIATHHENNLGQIEANRTTLALSTLTFDPEQSRLTGKRAYLIGNNHRTIKDFSKIPQVDGLIDQFVEPTLTRTKEGIVSILATTQCYDNIREALA